jgi:biotin transport system substrate-specific component
MMEFKNYPSVMISIAMAVLTGLLAQVRVLVGPIPYTLQNVGVVLSGLILKPKYAFISMTLYLILIVLGLPMASGFRGGLGVVLGYTGGYILGFIISAPLMSMLSRAYLRMVGKELQSIGRLDFIILLALSLIAILPTYALGFIVFTYYALGSQAILSWVEGVTNYLGVHVGSKILLIFIASVLIFIPQDLLMDHVIAITLAKYIHKIMTFKGVEI